MGWAIPIKNEETKLNAEIAAKWSGIAIEKNRREYGWRGCRAPEEKWLLIGIYLTL
jgi:hypothetical protein